MTLNEQRQWLQSVGTLTEYHRSGFETGISVEWSDGKAMMATKEYYGVETMYCKVKHYLDKI